MTARRFLIAALLGVACSTFSSAANPVLSVSVGSQPQLNDVSGLVNKNTVLKNNNVAITSSSIAAVQDDTLMLQEADGNLPPGVFLTGEEEPIQETSETGKEELKVNDQGGAEQGGPRRRTRRQLFCFPRGPRTICGWRYPIDFWFRRGRFAYGRSCPFNQAFGRYFYC